jgi:hypothetical protein
MGGCKGATITVRISPELKVVKNQLIRVLMKKD